MNSKDLIKELKAAGCQMIRQGKGDHQIWESAAGKRFTVPHPKRELPPGTLKSILKAAGLHACY